jgi:hypothetical protein
MGQRRQPEMGLGHGGTLSLQGCMPRWHAVAARLHRCGLGARMSGAKNGEQQVQSFVREQVGG